MTSIPLSSGTDRALAGSPEAWKSGAHSFGSALTSEAWLRIFDGMLRLPTPVMLYLIPNDRSK